jgi:hypothetical protein
LQTLFSNISGEVIRPQVPELLNYKKFSTKLGITTLEINHLELLNKELVDIFLSYNIDFEIAREKDALQYNKILLYSGKLRSKLYQRLKTINNSSLELLSIETLDDLWRKIQIIPLRWTAIFYSKILEFRSNMNAGAAGYFVIIKEIVVFALLTCFFVGFVFLVKRMNYYLEEIIENYKRKIHGINQSWLWDYPSNCVNS